MVVADEVHRHAMEVADKSKNKGIVVMLMAIPDPPEAGGVKVAPGTGKQRRRRTVGTVAGRVIERASTRRSAPIQTNPDPIKPNKEIDNDRTTLRAPKEPEMDRTRPL